MSEPKNLDDDLARLEATDPAVHAAAERLDETTTSILSTSARLRQTQQDLAASQADLTRMERDGRILARLVTEVTWGRDEARACWSQAERDLTMLRGELASATGELESLRTEVAALRRTEAMDLAGTRTELEQLRAARSWQVARNDDTPCAVCRRQIRRGEGFKPLPGAKGFFQHVLCPDPEPKE